MSSDPAAPGTTNGVLYDCRLVPRFARQRSVPVFLSTASRFDELLLSQSRIRVSSNNVGELLWPHSMSNVPRSLPRCRCHTGVPFRLSATSWPFENHA